MNLAFRILSIAFLLPQIGLGQGPDPHYKLLDGGDHVASKNYYLLTLFRELPDVRALLDADTVLRGLGQRKLENLRYKLTHCEKDGFCLTSGLRFSEDEIEGVAARLKLLYRPDNPLGKLVRAHLIPSGTYILYKDMLAADMLARAWKQDAEGINFVIGVYAEGRKPNYPLIDSISYNVHDTKDSNILRPGYVMGLLYNIASLVAVENDRAKEVFGIPLTAALRLLEINGRMQAADDEPMQEGENKAACDRVPAIKWADYPYSLIMVPGAGPEEPAVPLSGEGMIRCRLAAIQYLKKAAPFIVVSGGKVHPYKTKFCEAAEMKKFLVDELHIPANAIFIDPHARHTTTNMRNTVRLIHRYGLPFDKVALTCTTRGQSMMIEKTLIARCRKELNEAPYKNVKRLSETEVEFYPLMEALQINPWEPMDP